MSELGFSDIKFFVLTKFVWHSTTTIKNRIIIAKYHWCFEKIIHMSAPSSFKQNIIEVHIWL